MPGRVRMIAAAPDATAPSRAAPPYRPDHEAGLP
jgi:hypothetical protein